MATWLSLVGAVRRVSRAAEAALESEAVNPAQFLVLSLVDERGPRRQTDLVDALGTTAANVSQLLRKMETAGYIERRRDGAAKVVENTDAGRALLKRLRPDHRAFIAARFAGLDDAEMAALRRHADALG